MRDLNRTNTEAMKVLYAFTLLPLVAVAADAAIVWARNTTAFENERAVRFWLERDGDINLLQSVDFATTDGSAKAGVHYLAQRGTFTFAAGESAIAVEVELIDNGLLDGDKEFELILEHPTPGLVIAQNDGWNCNPFGVGSIRDNELPPTRVDALFCADRAPGPSVDGINTFAAPMPDGRVLISGGPRGITMLGPNGRIDTNFRPGGDGVDARFQALHVFGDGRILVIEELPYPRSRFVRLLPNGAVDARFPICNFEPTRPCPLFLAAQGDGKILLHSWVGSVSDGFITWEKALLVRLNPDGTEDRTFTPALPGDDLNHLGTVAIQADGKLLVYVRSEIPGGGGLVRLNEDGSLDPTFARFEGNVQKIVARAAGEIVIVGEAREGNTILQLRADGGPDPSFHTPTSVGWIRWLVEQPDGHLLFGGGATLSRLNRDGSLDTGFSTKLHTPPPPCQLPIRGFDAAVTPSGGILLFGRFDEVDGLPRKGLVHLLADEPRPDFRVVTPAEFGSCAGTTELRIVRTGDTTTAASVEFSTQNGTAKAGEHYLPQHGTLDFAPLDVSKTVSVQLVPGKTLSERITFTIVLHHPSAGYATAVPTPVVIRPDLCLEIARPSAPGSPGIVTVRGTLPGLDYVLDSSPDLQSWTETASGMATSDRLALPFQLPAASSAFFRTRRFR